MPSLYQALNAASRLAHAELTGNIIGQSSRLQASANTASKTKPKNKGLKMANSYICDETLTIWHRPEDRVRRLSFQLALGGLKDINIILNDDQSDSFMNLLLYNLDYDVQWDSPCILILGDEALNRFDIRGIKLFVNKTRGLDDGGQPVDMIAIWIVQQNYSPLNILFEHNITFHQAGGLAKQLAEWLDWEID